MMTINETVLPNETNTSLFKTWLTSHLKTNEAIITFTKKDGTIRTMQCTTSAEKIPTSINEETKREKKANDEVCCVFDTVAHSWRSFRWESIKSINFNLGE
jgi:hypothetical protein